MGLIRIDGDIAEGMRNAGAFLESEIAVLVKRGMRGYSVLDRGLGEVLA